MDSKIAVYIRVSSLEQANNGFWKDLQMTKIKNLINYRHANWEKDFIFNENLVFQDLWISGTKSENDRPGLQKMINEIKKWNIKKVLIWRLDRLARRTQLILELVDLFEEYWVEFISTDESIDTKSPTWKFFITILGAIGEMERSLISEKTFLWKLEAAKKWEYPFWKPPYWFIKNRESKKLEIIPKEKEIISRIFNLYTQENKSLNEIAKILRAEKIMKSDWRRIWLIIWNSTYNWNLYVNTHTNVKNKETWKTERLEKPQNEHILIKVEKFIDDKVFKLAQTKLKENKYLFNNNNKTIENHYFAWLISCWECLSNYKAYRQKNKNNESLVYYRCSKSSGAKAWKYNKKTCSNSQISEIVLLKKAFNDINAIIQDPENIEKKYLKDSNTEKNIKKYKNEIKGLNLKLDWEYNIIQNYYNDFYMETDDRIIEIIKNKIDKAKSNINTLKNRIWEIENYIKAEELKETNKKALYDFSKKLELLKIEELNKDEIITYLRWLIEKIIIHQDKIEFIYKIEINDENKKSLDLSWNDKSKLTGKSSMVELMGFEPMS